MDEVSRYGDYAQGSTLATSDGIRRRQEDKLGSRVLRNPEFQEFEIYIAELN